MTILKQAKERGGRIKAIFSMAQLSKQHVCEKYDVSIHTLNAWLSGSRLLSKKGADKLAQVFRQEGWFVGSEWLLSGKGVSPTPIEQSYVGLQRVDMAITVSRHKDEDLLIGKEFAFFRNANPDALILIVVDDSMEPHFSLGDYVGGIPLLPEQYSQVLGRVCIVDTESVERGLYIVHRAEKSGLYTLSVTNMQTRARVPIIANVMPLRIAPVVWQRKALGNIIYPTP